MHTATLLLAALQVAPGAAVDSVPDPFDLRPDSATIASAYEDETARELVRRARRNRGMFDDAVFHYTALSRQRLSVGVRALSRDRILYRREVASTIDWWRDRPGTVVVHGAREAVPVAMPGIQVPDDLGDWVRDFAPEPGADRLMLSPTIDSVQPWHPLVEGGEAVYRYASGDTTVVRLPDGMEVRLAELRVTPRLRDFRVVSGSFWFELDDYALVQAVFRPARDFELGRDLSEVEGSDADDEVPALLRPVAFDVRYVTVEYGLWEMRWWMPRLMAFEGVMRAGPIQVPVLLEITYSDYTVEADRYGLPELPPLTIELAGDPHARPRAAAARLAVVVPDDTASLLESDYLADSFYREGATLISEAELRELADRVGALPRPPWEAAVPRLTWPWPPRPGLLRYNRIEGLSIGARADWSPGPLHADLTARIGLADAVPRVELGADSRAHRSLRAAAYYRRLEAANPSLRPLAAGNSLTALLLGRDDGVYYEASGGELRVAPGDGRRRYDLRLYGEHQSGVTTGTTFHLARLAHLDEDPFRANIRARDADQAGLEAGLRIGSGADPTGARWALRLGLRAETGTFTFLRPDLGISAAAPLASLLGAIELAAGTSLRPGNEPIPPQSLWYLGGPATLRGFGGGALAGTEYVRGRAELATSFPAARVALFVDAGWAGRFEAWDTDAAAWAGGVGGSLLDGLARVDLARTFRPLEQWRVDFYLDALF